MKRSALNSFALRTLAGTALAVLPLLSQAWWNEAWTTRTKVTLNTSAEGITTQAAVNQVVLPIRLHSGNFEFAAAKEDGADLRVLAGDDKTPLPFTVERYDGVNELAVLWVKVPSVLPGTDKNTVYVYAGNEKVAAEPAAAVFDANDVVLHFAEPDGPAADLGGTVRSDKPVAREPNGLLGTSGRLVGGQALRWPEGERLRHAAGAPLTLSLWVRPENPASGEIVNWGVLKLSLVGGAVRLSMPGPSGALEASGGSLAANSWAHVALVSDGAKSTVYLNGTQVAEVAGAVPALQGALAVGEGFNGLVDELQLSAQARNADWIKLAAAAQGGEAKLVASAKEDSAAADKAEGGEAGYIGPLVKNLTTDAWVVIIILGIMFVLAVYVMITKALLVGRMDKDNRSFLARFRNAKQDLLQLEQGADHSHSPLFRLYQAGVRELNKRDEAVQGKDLSGASLNAVKASIDADLVREGHRLNDKMVLLTIAISGGPFLGLLGTVVGVMITFAAIAAAGDVNVNAIAPGIAAALLATVAGLGVAIPSLFGYNYLASRIKNISADMQIFVDEFVTRVAETYGAR